MTTAPSPAVRTRLPRVSVVVPCRDYGRFLERCVTSVLDQDGVDLDVRIIDDGSTDDTPEICARLAAADPRVAVTRHQTPHGHVATFNEGLAAAPGDHLVLLSADDALVPGSLGRAARFLDDEPGVGLVYGRAVFFGAEPLPAARTGDGVRHIRSGAAWIARRCRAGNNCISSPEVMVRATTLRQVGLFDPALPITGDLELWLRIASVADIGYLARTDQAYYRRHAASMYRSGHDMVTDLENRRAAFATFFAHHAHGLADAEALEADYRIALADEALWKACRAYDRGRVDTTPIGRLEYFAAATWPDCDHLPRARALRRRMRLGEPVCRALQPLGLYALAHHIAERSRDRHLARTGDL